MFGHFFFPKRPKINGIDLKREIMEIFFFGGERGTAAMWSYVWNWKCNKINILFWVVFSPFLLLWVKRLRCAIGNLHKNKHRTMPVLFHSREQLKIISGSRMFLTRYHHRAIFFHSQNNKAFQRKNGFFHIVTSKYHVKQIIHCSNFETPKDFQCHWSEWWIYQHKKSEQQWIRLQSIRVAVIQFRSRKEKKKKASNYYKIECGFFFLSRPNEKSPFNCITRDTRKKKTRHGRKSFWAKATKRKSCAKNWHRRETIER